MPSAKDPLPINSYHALWNDGAFGSKHRWPQFTPRDGSVAFVSGTIDQSLYLAIASAMAKGRSPPSEEWSRGHFF